jgi:hypothetical protein
MSFWGLLASSIALAALSWLVSFIYRNSDFALLMLANFFFLVLWFALLLYSLKTIGRRGLWLLVGLPLCLFWPLSAFLVWAICRLGIDCM